MRDMPSIVSRDGDMLLHGREGALLVLEFEDDAGIPRDMTAAKVAFEIEGFRKELVAGELPHQMILTLGQGELPNTIGRVVDFAVIDKSGSVPHLLWSGRLTQVGWR